MDPIVTQVTAEMELQLERGVPHRRSREARVEANGVVRQDVDAGLEAVAAVATEEDGDETPEGDGTQREATVVRHHRGLGVGPL